MVTLQQLFDIFKVSYNSPDGDYYPNRNVYIPKYIMSNGIPRLPRKLIEPYDFRTLYSVELKFRVPLVLKVLRISNHMFTFYEDKQFYYELENLEPACLFLSRDECLHYIMECSFLRYSDNVDPGRIEFYIKAAKINFAAYDLILKRVFGIGDQ